MTPIRERAVAFARACDGVGVTSSRASYLALVAQDEKRQDYFADPSTSGCGLVIRGIWRSLGMADRRVHAPYRMGTAISCLVGLARERKAWRTASRGAIPSPGDVVLVGGGIDGGGAEHVYVVTAAELAPDGQGAMLASIDGGQKDSRGQQCIRAKQRRWSVRFGQWWDVSALGTDPGANAPGGRCVRGWIDLDALWAKEAAQEPTA